MRSIPTIVPLTLGLVVLAVAGCQSRPDPATADAPTPTRVERPAPAPTAPDGRQRPPEQVALAFATSELRFHNPVTRRTAPDTYDVGQRNSEWAATLQLAQPVRHGAGGIWVVTRIASPEGSY